MGTEKKTDLEKLKVEYKDELEFEHSRLLLEISKAASRGLAGNVGFVAKSQARHHVIRGLLRD